MQGCRLPQVLCMQVVLPAQKPASWQVLQHSSATVDVNAGGLLNEQSMSWVNELSSAYF